MQNITFGEKRIVRMLAIAVALVFAIGAGSPSMATGDAESANSKISSFGVTQKTVYVKQGDTVKLPFVAYAKKRGKQLAKWESSAKSVATAAKGKSKGEITLTTNKTSKLAILAGDTVGKCKITLRADNAKITITVNVVKKAKPVKQKSLKIKGLIYAFGRNNLEFGQTLKLKPVFTKKATAIATWKSSKPKVAKVDAAGRITGVTSGWATITLKAGGKTKKMRVKVLKKGEGVDSMP
jgi:uncharacterized protein YjdB